MNYKTKTQEELIAELLALKTRVAELESQNLIKPPDTSEELLHLLENESNILHTVTDNLPDHIYIKDIQSRFLFNNFAHLRAMGATTAEEVRGKTDLDVYPDKFASQYYADEVELFKSGQPVVNREERVETRPDGHKKEIWVSATKVPIYNKNGVVIGLAGISRDITQQKETEQLLRQSNHNLETLNKKLRAVNEVGRRLTSNIRLSQEEILELIYDQTSKLMDTTNMYIAWYNQEKRELTFPLSVYEGSRETLPSRNVELDDPGKGGLTEIVIRTQKTLRIEDVALYCQKEGITLPTPPDPKSWLGVPILVEGNLVGVVVLYHYDLTEVYTQDDQDVLEAMVAQASIAIDNARLYYEVNQDLKQKIYQLEHQRKTIVEQEAVLTREETSNDFIHRLNNLVGPIAPRIQVVMRLLDIDNPKDKAISQHLDKIKEIGTKLLRIPHEVRQKPKPENVNINRLLDLLVENTKDQLTEENKIVIETLYTPDLYSVYGIYYHLENIIDSVINNGLEAMPNGGVLTIKTDNIINEKKVKIIIEDQGTGIPLENQQKVFSLNYSTKGTGRGYGLWRSKNLLEYMGGSIEYVSEVSKGTQFILILPTHFDKEM